MKGKISGLRFLYAKQFISIQWLQLYECGITDASPLSPLINLKVLNVGNNKISNLRFMRDMSFLIVVIAWGNRIDDVSELVYLSNKPDLKQIAFQFDYKGKQLYQYDVRDKYIAFMLPRGCIVDGKDIEPLLENPFPKNIWRKACLKESCLYKQV